MILLLFALFLVSYTEGKLNSFFSKMSSETISLENEKSERITVQNSVFFPGIT